MKKNLLNITAGALFLLAIVGTTFQSCSGPATTPEEIPTTVEGIVTVYYPNGTEESYEAYDITRYSESPSIWYYTMDGVKHNTNLPSMVTYK